MIFNKEYSLANIVIFVSCLHKFYNYFFVLTEQSLLLSH